MESLFQLPDELLVSSLAQAFPCRERQIRALATLIHPHAAPCRNIVLHGTEATGKTSIADALLRALSAAHPNLHYAIIHAAECITERHFFERTLAKVAEALEWEASRTTRCDDMTQLAAELARMLQAPGQPDNFRFVLVFDAIDRQREAQPTLLPALGRLSEIIPSLASLFLVTAPEPDFLETSFVPYVAFPNYTRAEFVTILAREPPPQPLPDTSSRDTAELWTRFCGAVCDALTTTAARTLPTFRHACNTLWPRFTAPVVAGTLGPRDFPRLLIAARVHFQDQSLLDPGIVIMRGSKTLANNDDTATNKAAPTATPINLKTQAHQPSSSSGLATLLPITARLLLLAAYLTSHNATKHDLTVFSTFYHGRKRRRGGGGPRRRAPKNRKIARKLLGAHAFVLERMLAVFAAVRREWAAGAVDKAEARLVEDADVSMAVATLASLRLLVRTGVAAGGGDPMDRAGKWRVNVGWETVRALGRSMGVEVEDWLVE